jgi:hypothetical protein
VLRRGGVSSWTVRNLMGGLMGGKQLRQVIPQLLLLHRGIGRWHR